MRLHLTGLWLALLVGVQITPASAESVPFECIILPGEEVASILRNRLGQPGAHAPRDD